MMLYHADITTTVTILQTGTQNLLFCEQEFFFLIVRNSDETKQQNSEALCIGIVSLLSA